jgi:type IV secretory pathway TraG/TraD family ATPase VirD4
MAITAAPFDYAGLFHALRATGAAKPVPRGLPPLLSPPGTAPNPWLLWFLGGILLGVLLFHREPWGDRLVHALSIGMWGTVLGGAFRTLRWLLRRRYDTASWEAVGLLPQCAFGLVLVGLPCIVISEVRHLPLPSRWWLWGAPLLGTLATPLVFGLLTGLAEGRAHSQVSPGLILPSARVITAARQQPLPFGLWLGQSTGILTALGHGAGLAGGYPVVLGLQDAAQNIAIFGGIGAGKTTRAVQPLLVQLLDQDTGGLIFDIKGDCQQAVHTLAGTVGRNVTVIGPHHQGLNLLAGLTPEVAASFLKSALILEGGRHDAFWTATAIELCRTALTVLAVVPEHYSLAGLYAYLFDPATCAAVDQAVQAELPFLPLLAARQLQAAQQYQSAVFHRFDEKVQAGVYATVAQVLAPFQHPDLVEAFCAPAGAQARLEDVLEGAVFLVDVPLAVWGLGGKVAAILLKLRFFHVMQRRAVEPTWNQERPVFFVCDEFQEIVSATRDGLSDLTFWDKARSTNTIGIIAAQAVSSFYAALGERDVADALLQNFRHVLCFRTEDAHTIDRLHRLIGQVDVAQPSYGASTSTGTSWTRQGGRALDDQDDQHPSEPAAAGRAGRPTPPHPRTGSGDCGALVGGQERR